MFWCRNGWQRDMDRILNVVYTRTARLSDVIRQMGCFWKGRLDRPKGVVAF
jgi:hypothetical protein